MPTALIADDEEAPRAQLLMALAEVWPELQVMQECVNGVDAWDAFLEHEPEVFFFDVRMPGLTGIEVAQRIGARAHIVFSGPVPQPMKARPADRPPEDESLT